SAGVSPPTSTAPPRKGAAAASCTAEARLPAATGTRLLTGGARRTTGNGCPREAGGSAACCLCPPAHPASAIAGKTSVSARRIVRCCQTPGERDVNGPLRDVRLCWHRRGVVRACALAALLPALGASATSWSTL